MLPSNLLPTVGKLNQMIFNIPYLGETLLRQHSRALAALAFYTPVLGGKRAANIEELKAAWLDFLARVGIMPEIIDRPGGFDFMLDACAYGFCHDEEAEVCDACMDLDRAYIGKLGGRLEILETIPGGASRCHCRVSLLR